MKNAAFLTMVWSVAVCCSALGSTPVVWVIPSPLHRVGPTDAPGTRINTVVRAERREYRSLQVAVQAPSGGLTNVNFSVSELVGQHGEVLSRSNLTLYREWYVTVKHHSPTYNGPPNLPITNVRTFPDALIPFLDPATGNPPVEAKFRAVPFDLAAGRNAVFWVDVFIPRNMVPGRYRGTYAVASDQGSFEGQTCIEIGDSPCRSSRLSNPVSTAAAQPYWC